MNRPGYTGERVRSSRWRVSLVLFLAILSFWVLWFAPLVLSVGLGRLYLALFRSQGQVTGTTGILWSVVIGVIGGASLSSAFVFIRITTTVVRVWRSYTPRRKPSGIPLNEGEAPQLFAMLERTRQRAVLAQPVEIRIDFTANINHTVRRRPRSSARRRTIVIGLPALAALSVEETELLLGFHAAFLTLPRSLLGLIEWTQFMARIRFFDPCWRLCDRALKTANGYASKLAARDGGDAAQALEALQKAGTNFEAFWAAHVQMVLDTGHLIPIVEGFQEYLTVSSPAKPASVLPAASLLRSPSAIEGRALNLIAQVEPVMETISWSQAAPVLLQSWKDEVEKKASQLRDAKVGDIRDLFEQDGTAFGRRVFHEPGRLYDSKQLREMTERLLAVAAAVALSRAGWQFVYCGPGSPLAFENNGKHFEPFAAIHEIAAGGVEADAWQATCASLDIAGLPLAS